MKYIKFSILNIIFLLSFSSFLIGVESSTRSFSTEELENSVAVDFDDLEISTEGIFLKHFGVWEKVDCLFEDSHGNYKAKLNSLSKNEWDFHWVCPKCNFKNGPLARKCKNCGYRG